MIVSHFVQYKNDGSKDACGRGHFVHPQPPWHGAQGKGIGAHTSACARPALCHAGARTRTLCSACRWRRWRRTRAGARSGRRRSARGAPCARCMRWTCSATASGARVLCPACPHRAHAACGGLVQRPHQVCACPFLLLGGGGHVFGVVHALCCSVCSTQWTSVATVRWCARALASTLLRSGGQGLECMAGGRAAAALAHGQGTISVAVQSLLGGT